VKHKRLKVFFKNCAFRAAHKIAIRRIRKIAKNSSSQIIKNDGKKILFNIIYGMYGKLIFWEGGLAKAMQMRGYDVKVLICGKTFTMCTSEYNIQSVHNDKTCKHCVDFSKEFLEVAGIPYSTYSDYMSDGEIEGIKNKVSGLSLNECKNLVYKEVEVGVLSMNAVLRYFEGYLTPDENTYELVLRSELRNAIIATDVAEKIVKNEKPDVLVTRHLGYSSWGSFSDYCINKGIRVRSPGEGYIENTIGFDFSVLSKAEHNFKKYFEDFRKKRLLNEPENAELQLFLDKRMQGKEGDTTLYGFSTDDVSNLFDLDKYKKTYAVFPNVAWDSSLLNAHKAFEDVYKWIVYTIELFKNKPEYQLIVKIHPSEVVVAKSKHTVSDYIRSNFEPLPGNIKIIPPDTKIIPYALFSFIDAGIVYNGTIGLEMTLHGIPVVTAGVTHYGRKGFTYDVSTKKEYKDLLFNDKSRLKKLTKQKIQLARVYADFYFLKGFYPYNFVYRNSFFDLGWNINSFDDMSKGKDESLDKICKYISEGIIY